MMGVSYRGERMIGNMPFSLFNGQKEKERKNNNKDPENIYIKKNIYIYITIKR